MSKTKSAKKTVWEVRYVGAPYGENESGEVVSRHRTEEAATAARRKLQSNPRYYGSNSRVVRVEAATTYTVSRYRDGKEIGTATLTPEQRAHWDAMAQQPEGIVRLGSLPHAYYDLEEAYQDAHEDTVVFIDE